MGRQVRSPHEIVNPSTLPAPVGFAHAVAAKPGRVVHVGGQVGHDRTGSIVAETVAAQFERAAANVVEALAAAGAVPQHLVSLHIYVTDIQDYRSSLEEIGAAYRMHFGRHYPAIALFGVTELFDPRAKVELVGTAVIPS